MSWTVDGTIGVDTDTRTVVRMIGRAVARVITQGLTEVIRIGIGPGFQSMQGTFVFEDILTLRVGLDLKILIILIGMIHPDTQMGTSDGLSRRGTDHHVAHALIPRLWLSDGKHIRHVQQTARESSALVCLELHHIDAHGQAFERHRVLEDLVGCLTCVGMCLFADHFSQMGFHLCIALGIVGRFTEVAVERGTIHTHGQRSDVAQLRQFHLLRLLGNDPLTLVGDTKLGISHAYFLILKGVFHAFPRTPLTHSLVDIGQSGTFFEIRDLLVSQHSQLSSLRQILIDLNHGVEFLRRSVFVHFSGGDTGSPTITHLIIIGMDILEVAVELITHHTQQIIVEDIRVDTFHDKGRVGLVLHLGQLFTELRRQFWCLYPELQHAILQADSVEHSLIHGLEHHVVSSLVASDDAIHGRFQ